MTEHEEAMKDNGTPIEDSSEETIETTKKIGVEAEDILPEAKDASPEVVEAQPGEATQADDKPSPPKKSAGKALGELKSDVARMELKLDDVSEFVQLAKNKLCRQAEEYINEGKLKVLESMFELHDMLFSRVMAIEAGSLEPDNFSIELFKQIQWIIQKHGVDIIIPQPGDPFDMNYMESLRAVPAKFWRPPGTVANVEKCGYSMQITEIEEKVLRTARVTVYRENAK